MCVPINAAEKVLDIYRESIHLIGHLELCYCCSRPMNMEDPSAKQYCSLGLHVVVL